MDKITPEAFRFRYIDRFPNLYIEDVQKGDRVVASVIEEVYGMFSGVPTLWSYLDIKTRQDKVNTCMFLLCAWYITDTYPEYSSVDSNGGMPVIEKDIGDVRIKYDSAYLKQGGLSFLKSNPYGVKAFNMLRHCSDTLFLYSRR